MFKLYQNLSQLLRYEWYTSHIVPFISIAIGLIIFIALICFFYPAYKQKFRVLYKTKARRLLFQSFVSSLIWSFCAIAFCFSILNMGQASMPANYNQHFIRTAIIDKRSRLPKAKAQLKENDNEYQKTDKPTRLEHQMEPTYQKDLRHQIHDEQSTIHIAEHLHFHWYYYV